MVYSYNSVLMVLLLRLNINVFMGNFFICLNYNGF